MARLILGPDQALALEAVHPLLEIVHSTVELGDVRADGRFDADNFGSEIRPDGIVFRSDQAFISLIRELL